MPSPADCCRDLSALPLLQALAERELPLRRGSLATVLFLRDRNERGQVRRGPCRPIRCSHL